MSACLLVDYFFLNVNATTRQWVSGIKRNFNHCDPNPYYIFQAMGLRWLNNLFLGIIPALSAYSYTKIPGTVTVPTLPIDFVQNYTCVPFFRTVLVE